jgi:hypothetical protein
VGTGDDALRPMSAEEARARLAESLEGFRSLQTAPRTGSSARGPLHPGGMPYVHDAARSPNAKAAQDDLRSWLTDFVPWVAPPGCYVARVAADPCVDGLGLNVRWLVREHLVVGRLAEGDLLD